MPIGAPRLCGCGRVVQSGQKCPACSVVTRRQAESRRPSARERGYDSKWDVARAAYLAKPENRLCRCGCGREADMIDHVIPHRGDMKLFWDRSNWQPLATSPCHASRKQRQERARG